LTSLFSVLYLKEKFYLRYLIGFILSFFGLFLFAFSGEPTEKNNNDLMGEGTRTNLGLFYSFIASFSITVFAIVNQNLREEVHPCILNHYCGWIGFIFSIPFLFYIKSFETSSGYVLLNFLNSFFYHIASTFYNISLIYNSFILIGTLSFSSIFLAFLYGLFLFGETIKLKEILGVILIVSYNLYSISYPIDNKRNELQSNENDLLDEGHLKKEFIANDDM